ncbi:hypothetical protein BE21_21240 [Sorangium cellulosum]|uniref:Uncharacterized protein n=1 Tax=Sorangium cellulosum TaxID=56 RepID=A0A150TVX5_SORCE|nr:hypothetical protein BE21_21240 [Sorangium cellulosum]
MSAARPHTASTLLLDERFGAGDDRFVDEVLASEAGRKLKALAPRWYADGRPFARRALLRYIDDGCDRPHHRAIVKTLYKLAEHAGDDEVIGHFMVAFDRLVRRKLVKVPRHDWQTGTSHEEPYLVNDTRAPVRLPPGDVESPRFSRRTRHYLRRRAFRYFRRLGRRDAARYGRAIRAALALYRDEHLDRPERLLDAWGLLHALYWGSPVLERLPRGVRLAEGAALADLEPAPLYPEAWQGAFDEVLGLVTAARSRTVRSFAIALLGRAYAAELRGLSVARVRALLESPHDEVQTFAAGLLQQIPGLEGLPIADWLSLLRTENAAALAFLCEAVVKHVAPARLSLAECVDLAHARAAPVAELGLRWVKTKPVKTAADLDTIARLATAGAPRVREEAVAWLIDALRSSPHSRAEHVRDLLDARHEEVRARGLELLESDARFRDDTGLWAALAETPHADARAFLIRHLTARKAALSPEALRHVWAAALLAVHGGARDKRAVLRQIADRVVGRPGEADALLPLLGVALRSVRPPERRAALGALARAAFRAPALRDAIARRLPELRLFEREDAA